MPEAQNIKMLNLGCGYKYIESWTNLDFKKTGKTVKAHNLLKGIPFPANTFHVLYHSHVLEHFSKQDGEKFIAECSRVLKPNGIIRIVVPNLEQIARNYITYLEAARTQQNPEAKANYEFTMLEMYDQTVRNTSGGKLGEYFTQEHISNQKFVDSRVGEEMRYYRANYFKKKDTKKQKLKGFIKKTILFLEKILPFYKKYNIGHFRLSGEIHQWMYDSFSLSELLKKQGFTNIKVANANESQIPNWEKYKTLDIENGKVRKPDSLFIEAIKK